MLLRQFTTITVAVVASFLVFAAALHADDSAQPAEAPAGETSTEVAPADGETPSDTQASDAAEPAAETSADEAKE